MDIGKKTADGKRVGVKNHEICRCLKLFKTFYPTPELCITGITLISILPAYKCQIGKSMMICVIFLWRAKAGANTEI